MELYRLKMGRPKKSDKSKEKPSQVEDAGWEEGAGVADQAIVRNVILTDSNGVENVENTEAGGSGLQSQGRTQSDTDSITDSSVDNVRKRL